MATIDVLRSNLANLENNLVIYEQEIDSLTNRVKEVITTLKDNSIELNSPAFDKILSYSSMDFSTLEKGLLEVSKVNVGNEIIDYSVTKKDLKIKESFTINGKSINIYTSTKTDALYVITSGLSQKERKQLNSELKKYLSKDQMAIVTFNGDYYQYNLFNKKGCTRDYAVIGKSEQGKMYAFETTSNSEIVVDDGHMYNSDTLITTINGMVIANKMNITMEAGVKINLKVRPQVRLQGGQIITEFSRLGFSSGTIKSSGSQYASVYMDGEWQKYANTPENKKNGTWINENNTNKVVTVGDGPQRSYPYKFYSVGHVDEAVIPIIIQAGNKAGSQRMQGTVCYHHDGARGGYESKDMLGFTQTVVTDWTKL